MKRRFFSYLIAILGIIFMVKRWMLPKSKKDLQFPSEYSNQENSGLLMRYVSPQQLPREYQDWLNPEIPLPKSNQFIPTKIGFGSVLFWLFGGSLLVLLGGSGLYLGFDTLFQQEPEKAQKGIAIFFILFSFVFLLLGIFNFKFMRDEFAMLRAKWNGQFRYGVFLSPSMMLIYLSNENFSSITKGDSGSHQSHKICHLIPRDRIENIEIKNRLTPRPGLGTISTRSEINLLLNSTLYDVLGHSNQISFSANALKIPGPEVVEILKQWSLDPTRASTSK